MFEPFGEIVSAKVFSNSNDGNKLDEEGDTETDQKKTNTLSGYGFVCFTNCEDARKALEHFHEKHDESSVSIDFHSTGRGVDDINSNFATQAATLPRLYVVPALKKELREAYVRMRTLKYKK